MALNFKKIWTGLGIVPKTTTTSDKKGELEVIDSTGKLNYHNGTSNSPVVTEAHTATITNKTIVAANNTITTAASGNLTSTELNAALAELQADITAGVAANVVGPASATDNAVARFDTTTGKLIQDSVITVSDTGVMAGLTGLSSSGTVLASTTLQIANALTVDTTLDNTTTGSNAATAALADTIVKLTNASLVSLRAIPTTTTSRVAWIQNATGNAITILNDAAATPAQGILTGTGANLVLPNGTALCLRYDATQARWTSLSSGADANLNTHIADATDAHAGSAISNTPSGNLAATTVQAALNELQTDVDTRATSAALTAHITNTTDAHDASAISVVPAGNLASTEVQAALTELQGDIDTINATKVTGPATATDNAVARYDATTGELIQDSLVLISDVGAMTGLTGLSSSGSVTASGALNLSGNTTNAQTGSNVNITSSTSSGIRLTGAGLLSIGGYAGVSNGRVTYLINVTGAPVTILNEDTTVTAAQRITTGTGSSIILANGATLQLLYNGTTTRNQVVGGVGAAGSAGLSTIFQLTGTDFATWSTGDNATFLGGGTLAGTFVNNTTTPLQGISDYSYTQAAGSLNDYLASPAQAVDVRFRGQQATLVFPYTYDGADNDIRVVFYDTTAGAEIPSSVYLQASTTVSIFKTNITIPSTCQSIRVGFQTAVLNSGKILEFDSVELTSDSTVYADIANITSWQSYTPTFTGFGTPSSVEFQWRQNGQNVDIRGKFVSGISTATEARITLPSGLTSASTSIIPSIQAAGRVETSDSAATLFAYTILMEPSVSYMTMGIQSSTNGGITKQNGNVVTATGKTISFFASVPTAQFTATNQNILTAPDVFSTDTAPLVYAPSSTYTLTTLANAPVGTFITYTVASSTNTLTQTTTAPTQTTADMSINGIQLFARAYNAASTAASPAVIAIQIGKNLKGLELFAYTGTGRSTVASIDYATTTASVEIGCFIKGYSETTGILFVDFGRVNSSGTNIHYFGIGSDFTSPTSGYLAINASKNPALTGLNISAVSARGVNTAGTSIANSGDIVIPYDTTKSYDTNGALNTTTGVFTAPETGYYTVSGAVYFASATYAISNQAFAKIYKNGTIYAFGLSFIADRAAAYEASSIVNTGVYLIKGETVELRASNNRTAGATSLNTAAGVNYFSVHKTSIG